MAYNSWYNNDALIATRIIKGIRSIFYFHMYSIFFFGFFLALLFIFYQMWIACVIVIIIFLLIAWARYVEPYYILTRFSHASVWFTGRYVLISDLHLWQHKDDKFLDQVVQKINSLSNIDAVLIAGDFMLDPPKESLSRLYAPLLNISYPVFAVLGNHDIWYPGPPWREQLVTVLQKYRVTVLQNTFTRLANGTVLVWLWDHWWWEDNVDIFDYLHKDDHTIVLVHNPDSILKYPISHTIALTLSWHTHWWQIRIPFLSNYCIPMKSKYYAGFYATAQTLLYVSAGLGEVGLPLRLFNPATIDVICLS